MLISVITVSFNAEATIAKTIESIINQENVSIEYIIIDGGSTDRTLEIIKSYESNIHKLVSEKDEGIYDAMNKGLKLASGTHVIFLNAGDTFTHSAALTSLIETQKNADLYCAETNLIDEKGGLIGTRSERTSRKLPSSVSKNSFLNGQIVSHQAFLAKKALCPKFDTTFKCSADIDWMIKVTSKAKSIVVSRKPLVDYLVGGFSQGNLRICWKERLQIMLNHFNPLIVGIYHIKFALRFLRYRIYRS